MRNSLPIFPRIIVRFCSASARFCISWRLDIRHHRQRSLWQLVTDIPDKLSVLVDRLLEKQPAKRFSSAADVREQLTKILAQHLTKHSCIFQPENLGWQT